MDPVAWHKIRSVIMIAAMKAVSISLDTTNDIPDIWEYAGYIFNPATCVFGPWIPFHDYVSIERDPNSWVWLSSEYLKIIVLQL